MKCVALSEAYSSITKSSTSRDSHQAPHTGQERPNDVSFSILVPEKSHSPRLAILMGIQRPHVKLASKIGLNSARPSDISFPGIEAETGCSVKETTPRGDRAYMKSTLRSGRNSSISVLMTGSKPSWNICVCLCWELARVSYLNRCLTGF